ncbi:creatininase family protein [Haloprofundus salinisoli]|uniref:creatininase family protein n=1 Tax=Haloprofundus salinisoli TaxID=2876193 RepID=UPI001CCBB07E|nr:creatininase family protein [Haloprofundus salinisoli]
MVYDTLGSAANDWAGKTYAEIAETADSDGSVLIVPVGSIEQHGHHLPVATDTILVDAVAHLGASRVEDDIPILVTPPVWSGYSPHHLPFGGTITTTYDTLLDLLEEICESALQNGFDAVVLVNGHGGNASLVASAVSTIGIDHPDTEVTGITYFELAGSFIDEIRESDVGGMVHAGEFETSLMLHLRPDLVRDDRIEGTMLESEYEHGLHDMFAGGPFSVYRGFDEYSETGAIGAPELATAEKGERIYERLGDEVEAVLREVYDHALA